MTTQRTSFITFGGDAPGSRLTRLRMGDELFSSGIAAGNGACAGFIIIRRGEVEQMPRPSGLLRRAARTAG